jgi:DNA-binding transcriptional ArsR family regulator
MSYASANEGMPGDMCATEDAKEICVMPKDEDGVARPVEMRRRRRPPEVGVIASPMYDLLLSLFVAFSQRNSDFELDPQRWVALAHEHCPPELLATLTFFFGDEDESQWCASRLCKLLWQNPTPLDIAASLDWLAQLPVEQLFTVLLDRDGLGDDWYDTAIALIQARTGDANRKGESKSIQAFSRRFPAGERGAVVRFLTEPEAERARLIDALHQWHERVFAPEAPRITAALTREAAAIAARLGEAPLEEVFASIVRGIEFNLPASMDRLVLAPSVVIMPTVFYFPWGDTATYCFPITDTPRSGTDGLTAQRHEMVRLFEALSDDTRLRILRHLSERQMYLTELSEHLKLTKATTRHHMVRLRAAGLVTLHMRDHLSYYSLNRETLDEPTRMLVRYLGLTPVQG